MGVILKTPVELLIASCGITSSLFSIWALEDPYTMLP